MKRMSCSSVFIAAFNALSATALIILSVCHTLSKWLLIISYFCNSIVPCCIVRPTKPFDIHSYHKLCHCLTQQHKPYYIPTSSILNLSLHCPVKSPTWKSVKVSGLISAINDCPVDCGGLALSQNIVVIIITICFVTQLTECNHDNKQMS